MAKFLTTHNTVSEIENIIRNAHGWLVIISPYYDISDIFLERLKDAALKNIDIKLVYGKKELNKEQIEDIKTIKNATLWFYEDVHAKCYCNENSLVVTSLNMYDFSQKNNREMGVLLDKQVDSQAYSEGYEEVQSILRSSTPKPLYFQPQPATAPVHQPQATQYRPPTAFPPLYAHEPEPKKPILGSIISNAFNSLMGTEGYCIRCGKRIEFDPEHPLCGECFDSWNKFKNPKYIEEYCHSCGKAMKSTKEKPLCKPCYSKL